MRSANVAIVRHHVLRLAAAGTIELWASIYCETPPQTNHEYSSHRMRRLLCDTNTTPSDGGGAGRSAVRRRREPESPAVRSLWRSVFELTMVVVVVVLLLRCCCSAPCCFRIVCAAILMPNASSSSSSYRNDHATSSGIRLSANSQANLRTLYAGNDERFVLVLMSSVSKGCRKKRNAFDALTTQIALATSNRDIEPHDARVVCDGDRRRRRRRRRRVVDDRCDAARDLVAASRCWYTFHLLLALRRSI
jgi:hypothetical protein